MTLSNNPLQFIVFAFLAFIPSIVVANSINDSIVKESFSKSTLVETHENSNSQKEKEFNASEMINEHIGDSHEFHIIDWKGHPISLYLPVILLTDNGISIFSSEKFHHDNSAKIEVVIDGQNFVRNEEVIYYSERYKLLSEDDKGAFIF